MSDLFPTAGCRIYIGGVMAPQNADFAAPDFSGQDWVEIDGWSQMGALGDTGALITTSLINRGRDVKQKGTFNAGQMQNVFASLPDDLGQVALIAASATRSNFAFRVVLNDAPLGGTPGERMFVALVMGAEEAGGDANAIRNLNATLEINSNIVKIATAGGSGTVPNNTALPAITGTATEGQTLSLSNGTWTGAPSPQFTYQWFADGESLPGATAATLELTSDHIGAVITGMVKATNIIGTAYAMSAATAAVSGL